MGNTLLLRADEKEFNPKTIEHVFRTEAGFGNVRFHEPGGAAIECRYTDPESGDSILVRLSGRLTAISLADTSDIALRAAVLLQARLQIPLRMVDTDYTYDLNLSDHATLDELNAAIDEARAEGS